MSATTEAAVTPQRQGFDEISILWISEGMSCDGDTVAMTASAQPAIEDVVNRAAGDGGRAEDDQGGGE